MNPIPEPAALSAESTMKEILAAHPGAQRALFRGYHIGGCASCGFQPDETLRAVCARNDIADPGPVLDHIRASHEQDARLLLEPRELDDWRRRDPRLRLIDIRTREEFEAVHIEGSTLLTQEVMREILAEGAGTPPVVLIDHQGRKSLDAAAYFLGHGAPVIRCLRGGIDAWAQDIDPALPRYRLG